MNSVADSKWVSKKKSISRAKLIATSQEERIQKWKENFKNQFANSPKVTNKSITKIINSQQDIKLGQFIQEEVNEVLRKMKNGKAASFTSSLSLRKVISESIRTTEA